MTEETLMLYHSEDSSPPEPPGPGLGPGLNNSNNSNVNDQSQSLAPLQQAAIPVSKFLDVNDCVPVALISDKHQRSPALNDPNNKRQKIMISATIRKQKNEDSCPIYKLSNDELMHIIGYQHGKCRGLSVLCCHVPHSFGRGGFRS
jgi:hypothetical protein